MSIAFQSFIERLGKLRGHMLILPLPETDPNRCHTSLSDQKKKDWGLQRDAFYPFFFSKDAVLCFNLSRKIDKRRHLFRWRGGNRNIWSSVFLHVFSDLLFTLCFLSLCLIEPHFQRSCISFWYCCHVGWIKVSVGAFRNEKPPTMFIQKGHFVEWHNFLDTTLLVAKPILWWRQYSVPLFIAGLCSRNC